MVFIVMVVYCIRLYNRRLVEYRYTLIAHELIFEKMVGGKEKPVLQIDLRHILEFGLVKQYPHNRKIDRTYRFTFQRNSSKAYFLLYEEGNKINRIIFEPSEKLIAIIKRNMQNRQQQS